MFLKVGCINVRDLGSSRKQGGLHNDLRWISLNIAVSETKIADTWALAPIFDDFEIFASLSRPEMGVLLRKGLDLKRGQFSWTWKISW